MRLIGSILGVLAIGAAAWDLAFFGRLRVLGEWWHWLHSASLQQLQAGVQRNLSPALWDWALQPLLLAQTALLLAALAVALWTAAMARRWR